ncbi:sensor histidine kinase [Fibrella aquatica]|jgi:Histidine kinase|uniref:sensor histidine kinase n=1 Tax=Fibrella aquatica TaxID=3242487 RepID=UPI0035213166
MIPTPNTSQPAMNATYLTSRFWISWKAHWPLWLGALGVLWLGTSLLAAPLTDWLTTYAQSAEKVIMRTNDSAVVQDIVKGTKDGWNEGHELLRIGPIGSFWYLVWTLLVPVLLLLCSIGYYIYWHVARNTLFDMSTMGKLAFVVFFGLIWLVWQAVVISGITHSGPLTAKVNIDSALPTLAFGFWLIQCLIMHVFVRQKEQRELVQNARLAELAALTAQVNPPFIFHALQHLQRAAIDEQLPRTAQSLEQLTGIMQYVLEESRKEITETGQEIGFIRDYLRLQQLRLPQRDSIQISTDVAWDGKPAPIVPLLLNPLIENAFKYGISIQHPCFVTVRLHVTEGVLSFSTENSILPRTDLEAGTGMGLRNVRKRLRLAYPDRHKLTITEKPDRYRVDLHLRLC